MAEVIDEEDAVPTEVTATGGGTEREEEATSDPSAAELPSPPPSSSDSVSVKSKGTGILGAASRKLKGSMPVSFPKKVTSKVNKSWQLTPARAMVMCCNASRRKEAAFASNSLPIEIVVVTEKEKGL